MGRGFIAFFRFLKGFVNPFPKKVRITVAHNSLPHLVFGGDSRFFRTCEDVWVMWLGNPSLPQD